MDNQKHGFDNVCTLHIDPEIAQELVSVHPSPQKTQKPPLLLIKIQAFQ